MGAVSCPPTSRRLARAIGSALLLRAGSNQVLRAQRGAGDGASGTADLRSSVGLTLDLLEDPPAWRERLVEEIVLDDRDHVEASSSYQMCLSTDLVQKHDPEVAAGDVIRLLLPVTTRPKKLLFDVDVAGPSGATATLVLRREIAELQAAFVERLAAKEGWQLSRPCQDLIAAICQYTDGHFAWMLSEVGDEIGALARYLRDGTGLEVAQSTVEALMGRLEGVGEALRFELGLPPVERSPAEAPLLALPFLPHGFPTLDGLERMLADYVDFVDHGPAAAVRQLASYGRRWEVILDTAVTVGERGKVKLQERRPSGITGSSLKQEVVLGDARTVHVEVRIADHHVNFVGAPRLRDIEGDLFGIPVVDAVRSSRDAIAIYGANPSRPLLAELTLDLSTNPLHRRTVEFVTAMVALSLVLAATLPDGRDLVDSLALLAVPVTLAGAVVLTRDASALATHLDRHRRVVLGASMLLLWVIVTLRLASGTLGPEHDDLSLGWLADLASWAEARLEDIRGGA